MKKLAFMLAMLVMFGLLFSPVWASDKPAIDELINDFYEKRGEAFPQRTWGYWYSLVTNAYDQGWGSIFVLTNYSISSRIQIDGYVVPTNAFPGEQIPFRIFLDPFEVRYVNLSDLGLGSENAWAIMWSTNNFFGSGTLIYCTNNNNPGISWVDGWYYYEP
jgi:hypothetical protein